MVLRQTAVCRKPGVAAWNRRPAAVCCPCDRHSNASRITTLKSGRRGIFDCRPPLAQTGRAVDCRSTCPPFKSGRADTSRGAHKRAPRVYFILERFEHESRSPRRERSDRAGTSLTCSNRGGRTELQHCERQRSVLNVRDNRSDLHTGVTARTGREATEQECLSSVRFGEGGPASTGPHDW